MNLLYDPLFRVLTEAGPEEVSLPTLLELFGEDAVRQLVGIQRYQADAFHVFLAYLGGAVLARRGDTSPVQAADYWRTGLMELAGPSGEQAWSLLEDDLLKPAFMQPPLLTDKKSGTIVSTLDELDVLQTAKNHDIKRTRADRGHPDEWIYALISLQTMSGFSGNGNYGISRMNGGHGTRMIVELIRSRRLGKRWADAVERLLGHRKAILAEPFGYDPKGLVLVWTEPWDQDKQLSLSDLDPFYIEICRRVRLVTGRNGIQAAKYSTRKPRIAAQQLKGVLGDPWLPVELRGKQTPKALTISLKNLTTDLRRRLIFGEDFRMSALQAPGPKWADDLWFAASFLVRGQNTTDGFYEWEILIPRDRVRLLFGPHRTSLAELSRLAISHADNMQDRVLKPAVFELLQGGPRRLRSDHKASQAWWTRCARQFEQGWSEDYFPWLFSVPEDFDLDLEERRWVSSLRDHALKVLDDVEASMPSHSGRWYRAVTAMRNRFWGAFFSDSNFGFMRGEMRESAAEI